MDTFAETYPLIVLVRLNCHYFTDAILKLDEALAIEPNKHEALWCMGNAQTSYAFLMADRDEAKSYFDSAYTYFQKAIEEASFSFNN